jgi:hypothetical protein
VMSGLRSEWRKALSRRIEEKWIVAIGGRSEGLSEGEK